MLCICRRLGQHQVFEPISFGLAKHEPVKLALEDVDREDPAEMVVLVTSLREAISFKTVEERVLATR
jgi:hypothetical protein